MTAANVNPYALPPAIKFIFSEGPESGPEGLRLGITPGTDACGAVEMPAIAVAGPQDYRI